MHFLRNHTYSLTVRIDTSTHSWKKWTGLGCALYKSESRLEHQEGLMTQPFRALALQSVGLII
jgi:hypothetical protein